MKIKTKRNIHSGKGEYLLFRRKHKLCYVCNKKLNSNNKSGFCQKHWQNFGDTNRDRRKKFYPSVKIKHR